MSCASPVNRQNAREQVNQAQFDQAELVEEGQEVWREEPREAGDAEDRDSVDPAQIVRGFHRATEFTDLIGVCRVSSSAP
ncbi:hypothetical protein, partial [Streptomyces formicae]